jgi:DNA-binding MarR family transcriptional regulator
MGDTPGLVVVLDPPEPGLVVVVELPAAEVTNAPAAPTTPTITPALRTTMAALRALSQAPTPQILLKELPELVMTIDCRQTCRYHRSVTDPSGVTDPPEWFEEVSMPALLRAARGAYGSAIRAALAEAECDDVPPNGSYVIGALARTGAPLGDIIRSLGVSKQAAGQVVDTLVTRGYLDRSTDPADRRRLTINLTERGEAAAEVIRSAVEELDAALVTRVGGDSMAQTRATLAALITLGPGDA